MTGVDYSREKQGDGIPNDAILPTLQRGGLKKVVLGQLACDGGRIDENVEKIINAIEHARDEGADLIIFPELSIPGYLAMDHFYDEDFLAWNRLGLERIRAASQGINVIVGFADQDPAQRLPGDLPFVYNAAAVIQDGVITHIAHKTLLPNYRVFDEKRYFQPGEKRGTVNICGTEVGIAICEDLWADDNKRDIAKELVASGAQMIVALNASPFNEGKVESRMPVMQKAAAENNVPIIWVNNVGAGDAYLGELLFDGRSMILDSDGNIRGAGATFREDLPAFDLSHLTTGGEIPCDERIAEKHDALVMALRELCRKRRFEKLIIGISGGIDSAVSAALAVEAIGAENVIGVTLPSKNITSPDTYFDALALCKSLGIECRIRPISREFEAWLDSTWEYEGREPGAIARQNYQSGLRGNILLRLSNDTPRSAVLNNGNKTERFWGYYTLGGDGEGAIAVLGDIHKDDIRALAKHINSCRERSGQGGIPESIVARPPSADLEPGQTDEGSLGYSYDEMDELSRQFLVEHASARELYDRFGREMLEKAEDALQRNEGKGRQVAGALRVDSDGHGHQRRVSMDHTFRKWRVAEGVLDEVNP